MIMPSWTVNCGRDSESDMEEKAKGINIMRSRMYTDAQTSPKLSGLRKYFNDIVWHNKGQRYAHLGVIGLQQVSSSQISIDESRPKSRHEIKCCQ